MTVSRWKVDADYDVSEEYVVEGIVAERRAPGGPGARSVKKQYLMKYAGFELDVGGECWLPLAEVKETEAYEKWLKGGREAWHGEVARVRAAAGVE
jgi:hypothetical protein